MNLPKWFRTLNPVDGCPGNCPYCYARGMNKRFHFVENWNIPKFFPERLEQFDINNPTFFFIDSMSDFATWNKEWQRKTIEKIEKNKQHIYMSLTKFPELYCNDSMPSNYYYGVTVTNNKELARIDIMKNNVKGCKYHVCFEPLTEKLENLDLSGISWIEIGEETGFRKTRVKCKPEWIYNVVGEAKKYNIPILMKDSIKQYLHNDIFECSLPVKLEEGKFVSV